MSAAAAQRGAGGERKAPCKRHDTATLPKSVPCRRDGRADSGAGGGAAAPRGEVLSFASKESTKESQRHGDSRGGPRRYAPWASVCGSPSGCPRARGVRCRIAPYRSLCSPPTLPAGRFGLRPRPHWGHASLRDSSLRSPAGKKPFIAHFAGGARNVARNLVGQLTPSTVRAPVLTFFRRQNGRAFFPPLPIAALLPRRWLWLGSNSGAWDVTMQLVLQRRKKDSAFSQ